MTERTVLRCPDCERATITPKTNRSGAATSRYYCSSCGKQWDDPDRGTTDQSREATTSPHIESIRAYRDGGEE